MAGTCFTYKKVYIGWDTGHGYPYPYNYTIHTKKGKSIEFSCNKKNFRKTEEKVKKYIDEHLNELLECDNYRAQCYKKCIKDGIKEEK